MRSNGLHFALAALLAPSAVFAQATAPVTEASAQTDTSTIATDATTGIETPVQEDDNDIYGNQGYGPIPEVPPAPLPPETAPAQAPDANAAAGTDAATTPPATDADANTQTEAEQAFGDIYGNQEYADPNLPAAAVMPGTYDPWEKYNRKMHRFNNAVDRHVAKPLARGYVKAVPRPVRLGVSNFFNNLSQPLTMVNSLLQGKPKQAGQTFGRFLLNTTFGLGGIFDPATRANLPKKSEDFGQTLGVWGWKRSRYFELPLFGPRTVRDVFGMAGDAPLSPLRSVEADKIRVPLQGLQLVDMRSQLLSTDSLREGAEDDYTLVRDAWSQRRDYQIFGDRPKDDGRALPDYLLEEEDKSTVPVDAMPVVVPGGGGGT